LIHVIRIGARTAEVSDAERGMFPYSPYRQSRGTRTCKGARFRRELDMLGAMPARNSCKWFALAGLTAVQLLAQNQQKQGKTDFNKPFPPHKVIGNVYYVGSESLATFLVTTPQGHILINSDFEATVPVIRSGVEKLGFKFTDVKILVGSHAHGDHMEGDALVKELTAAQVVAMEQDVPALRLMKPGNKPHPIDRVIKDGEEVKLGGTTLVAHLTPGHTKGCTTWTLKTQEAGKTYDVVIVCSVGVNPGYVLVGNKDYPQIAEDYVRSFKILRSLPCDVFLGAHGNFYNLAEKYPKLAEGKSNPFIDPAGYRAYIDTMEKNFNARLAEQKK
jgi:metallo-beta-lactamase class B